nr:serine hydrolase domain-containing protein [uncultured Dyadobacter sp.]
MRRRNFLAATGPVALAPFLYPLPAWPGDVALHEDQLTADLKVMIPKLMDEATVPGLSIALVRNGKLSWHQGFGVKDNVSKEPVSEHTVFEAASVSKTVFAYAALKLCEKGILDLDKPLSKDATVPLLTGDPRAALITPRTVLSHTTGVQNMRSGDEPLKIHFNPGTQFLYSGEGYWYLQSVITDLAGKENKHECAQYEAGLKVCATDIDAFMAKNLLDPFGMTDSGYVWRESFAKHAASPHDTAGKPFAKSKPGAADTARYASMGGLHTTASDYARFLIEVIAPKPQDAFRLSPKTHDEMLRPQIKLKEGEKIDGADAWALGWAIQQRKTGNVILHSGGQAGFRSLTMASVERKSGFVMLTNGDNGGKVIFHPKLAELLNILLTE